jgi:hypothetical protein
VAGAHHHGAGRVLEELVDEVKNSTKRWHDQRGRDGDSDWQKHVGNESFQAHVVRSYINYINLF